MNKTEFIEFLESIGMFRLRHECAYLYSEYKNTQIIHQKISIYESEMVSVYLYIHDAVSKQIIQSTYDFSLSSKNLKERIIKILIYFYETNGIIPNNLKYFVRERKIKEILD